jgi:hypothetical protein
MTDQTPNVATAVSRHLKNVEPLIHPYVSAEVGKIALQHEICAKYLIDPNKLKGSDLDGITDSRIPARERDKLNAAYEAAAGADLKLSGALRQSLASEGLEAPPGPRNERDTFGRQVFFGAFDKIDDRVSLGLKARGISSDAGQPASPTSSVSETPAVSSLGTKDVPASSPPQERPKVTLPRPM